MVTKRAAKTSPPAITFRKTELLSQLDHLVATGYFGRNRTEVAEGLLRSKIRELKVQGWFDPTAEPQKEQR